MTEAEGPFLVEVAHHVDQLVRDAQTPRRVRTEYVTAYRALLNQGCKAASYRLSGDGEWPRFCVLVLPSGWRLVMDFPASRELRILLLAPHTKDSDPYGVIAEALGVERAPGSKDKPACCDDDGTPPQPTTLDVKQLEPAAPRRRARRR